MSDKQDKTQKQAMPHKDPSDMPTTDRPERNSKLYNELRKEDSVDPEQYPKKDRDAADLTGKDQ